MASLRSILARAIAPIAATFLLAMPAAAQNALGTEVANALPDRGEFHLGLFNGGEADGTMRLGWIKRDDGILLYDRTMMPSDGVYEVVTFDLAPDFTFRDAHILYYRGVAHLEVDLDFDGSHVTGRRTIHRLEEMTVEEVDLELPENSLPRPIAFLMPMVLSAEDGAETVFPWFGPLGNAMADVTVTARPGGTIETPAGSFDTIRYEIRGGAPDNDVYVTRGVDRRVVRIDVVGQDMQFLALPDPAAVE
ncbi:hypothetical protein [Parasphingopyxis marina]|uniref:Uncharacterized protein n=1 Tax=Parasphingopyxis marina TaxID=2761622 RepID=A0A842HY72_9SPHN|nr:hypothetical protein [Parasphingopyxis marina]MBC2777279.1 hypothetical protein [Parasphingopyxis marina]